MARIQATEFTCGHCNQTGRIATSTLNADKPVQVVHSATAGGCGLMTTVGKKGGK
jgi:transcription elongation factor Elf1